jgi:hypothetical protein
MATSGEMVGWILANAAATSAVAFGMFKLFAEKWLNSKFQRQLEEFKHAQQKEIEQLRFRINAMMDRATKLHQRAFDVLPEAWSRLNDACGKTLALVRPYGPPWRGI